MSAFEENEISEKSQGGTEQCKRSIAERMPKGLTDDFQVICSRVREIKEDKIRVYWIHDLPEDPECNHLKDLSSQNRFHKIVFAGNWQYNRFLDMLGIAPSEKLAVIDTPFTPLPADVIAKKKRDDDKIRLIYTSTPQRGLALLVPVFIELAKKYDNIVLDVFSSFEIYGWGHADDQFKDLFDACKNHPQINYHGFQPNEVVREALTQAHFFTYPSVWMECNSRSLIEAMSAGCICIHPNLAGLSDTSGNITMLYQWIQNPQEHARKFYSILDQAIANRVHENEMVKNYTQFVKLYADSRFDINKISAQWQALFLDLKEKYPTVESRKLPGEMFVYRV